MLVVIVILQSRFGESWVSNGLKWWPMLVFWIGYAGFLNIQPQIIKKLLLLQFGRYAMEVNIGGLRSVLRHPPPTAVVHWSPHCHCG
ncbi:hypothetical protein Gotri_020908 [Gossypium trilobum]|uniref:Uncharacterized protein n=1 Tax=Gossypium trilobum TaxID=34281 RepID=A0A7J9DB18_9ROSI|nr:hypothetical protein [Gossypium trilobum]